MKKKSKMLLFPLMVLIVQLTCRFSESRPMDMGYGAGPYEMAAEEASRNFSRAPQPRSGKGEVASSRRTLFVAYHSPQRDWSDEFKERVCSRMRRMSAPALAQGLNTDHAYEFAANVVHGSLLERGVQIKLEDVLKIWNEHKRS